MIATMTKRVSLTPAQRYQVELLAQAGADFQHDHICNVMHATTQRVMWRKGLIDCDKTTWTWRLTPVGYEAAHDQDVIDRGTFAAPGTAYGPHVDCDHGACQEVRRDAARECLKCQQPIGYGREYVSVNGRFFHADEMGA